MTAAPLISIVDDDESLLLALSGLLRSYALETRVFVSAEAFIESREAEQSNCIIADIQLPGISGITLKRWLEERHNNVPVIIITARTEPELGAAAMASGALCVLRKPFEAEALLACLRRADVAIA